MDALLDQSDQGVFNAKAVVLSTTVAPLEPNADLKVFTRFFDLRVLMLGDFPLIGGHAHFPRSLAMLLLDYCDSLGLLPVSFNAERLVDIRVLFRGRQSSLKGILGLTQSLCSPAKKLRYLYIAIPFREMIKNHCAREQLNLSIVELSKCLDPQYLPALEELRIDGWGGAVRLADSFSNLERLRTVTISTCEALVELPSFRRLSTLELLHIQTCPNLKSSPISSGLSASLKRLIIEDCSSLAGNLWGSVSPIGNASKLQHLTLDEIRCSSLPDTFGQLLALETVTFKWCFGLPSLPGSFGGLQELRGLKIEYCKDLETLDSINCGGLICFEYFVYKLLSTAQRLPQSFGELSALSTLRIEECWMLDELPESFGRLPALQDLDIRGNPLKSLPKSFGNLRALQVLQVERCCKLETLSVTFGELSALKSLILDNCLMLKELPESFGCLHGLQTLSIVNSNMLMRLPKSFGQLCALRTLRIEQCSMLQSLSEEFGLLSSLQKCTFTKCKKLRRLPESFGQLHDLQTLSIVNCDMLVRLPWSFGQLLALKDLDMRGNPLRSLPETFGKLRALQMLQIDHCYELETFSVNFGGLSTLSLVDCNVLVRLPKSFGHLHALKALTIKRCGMLQSLSEDFGLLSSLQKCTFGGCKKLKNLPNSFVHLSALEELSIWNCPVLEPLKLMLSMSEVKEETDSGLGEGIRMLSTPEVEGETFQGWEEDDPALGAVWRWKKQSNPIGACFSRLEDELDLFESLGGNLPCL